MINITGYLQRVVLTFWAGSLWVTGFIVTPILFSQLDRHLAGNIAGKLFQILSFSGLFSLAFLTASFVILHRRNIFRMWQFWMLLTAIVITVFGEFYLADSMREIKFSNPQLLEGSQAYTSFSRLHVISRNLYLVNCILGLFLVLGYGNEKGKNS